MRKEIGRVIVGQKQMIDRLLVGLLSNGHVLVEGVPGMAKTTAVSTLAKTLQLTFHRLQFTPDLLPADLIGTLIGAYRDAGGNGREGGLRAAAGSKVPAAGGSWLEYHGEPVISDE